MPLPQPPVTLAQLAQILPEATLVGDGNVSVSDLVHPMLVSSPLDLVLIIDPAALGVLQTGIVQAAIVADEIPVPENALKGYIKVKRPRHALAYLLNVFDKPVQYTPGIHPTALVEEGAQVHASASLGPYVVVGKNAAVDEGAVLLAHVSIGANAKIGRKTLLHPGVRIGDRVLVGSNVIIHHNASIGADGFSFVTPDRGSVEAAKSGAAKIEGNKNTEIIRINSIGTVILEDNVEIGACACIDRATLGATLIKRGTKIDNLVQIGHNNTVGENCLMAGQSGLAGSCRLGDRVAMGGQAAVGDHLKIGDDAVLMAKSGIMRDVEAGSVMGGAPAVPAKEFMRGISLVGKLSEMRKEMKAMQKRLEELEKAELEKKGLEEPARV